MTDWLGLDLPSLVVLFLWQCGLGSGIMAARLTGMASLLLDFAGAAQLAIWLGSGRVGACAAGTWLSVVLP